MIRKYIGKALVLYVGYFIICGGLDAIFRGLKPLQEYAIAGLLFTAFVLVLNYFVIRTPLSSTIMSLPPLLPLLTVGLRSPSSISRHMFLISVTRWRVSRLSPL